MDISEKDQLNNFVFFGLHSLHLIAMLLRREKMDTFISEKHSRMFIRRNSFLTLTFQSQPNFVPFHLVHERNLWLSTNVVVYLRNGFRVWDLLVDFHLFYFLFHLAITTHILGYSNSNVNRRYFTTFFSSGNKV